MKKIVIDEEIASILHDLACESYWKLGITFCQVLNVFFWNEQPKEDRAINNVLIKQILETTVRELKPKEDN